MNPRTTRAVLPAGAALAVAVLLAGCTTPEPVEDTAEPRQPITLSLGALLPDTGTLAAFGPATHAAVQLAVDDIADADSLVTVEVEYRDAGDSAAQTGTTSVEELLALDVDALVGPLSDGVSKKVIDTVVDAGVIMVSPGNTAPDFSTYPDDDLYWRTSPPCTLEGDALAQQVADSGATSVGLLTQTETCGAALTDAVVAGLEQRDVEIAAEASLDGGGTVDAAVAAFTEAEPDAVAIVTSQGKAAIAPLSAAGFAGDQMFFLGLPPGDYGADFAPGILEDATLTLPGPDLPNLENFTDRLIELTPNLTEFSYSPETYDAVVLIALAALQAGDTRGSEIAAQMQAVSGGVVDSTPCTSFEECAALIIDGVDPDYEGISGSVTFTEDGDPTGAVIGVFRAGDDNRFLRID